ncbi:hypothetical protein, partial [Klebsiella pneumoniae]|uniref:hypothetical protein n=1 Tax=Klebsiella pneumoniae TaxID=573 RepID=UPI001953F0A5
RKAAFMPSFKPSFAASGVPEYPAAASAILFLRVNVDGVHKARATTMHAHFKCFANFLLQLATDWGLC